jgi:Tfp pilus assembly protein PilZ
VSVELAIGDDPIEVAADVAYRQTAGAAGRAVREGGIGVAFRGLDDAQRATIAAFIGERIRSFRL